MTVPTNTYTTYTAAGQAEDFSNAINIVVQEQAPFQLSVGKGTAYARFHQWQTDVIKTPSNSPQIEGDTLAGSAITPTVAIGNYTQIQLDAIQISQTEETVRKYGRASEMAYQLMKSGIYLKLSMEKTLVGTNLAYSAGSITTGRQCAGVLAYIKTNTSIGAGGANPTGNGTDARTDGTVRPLTQSLFNSVMESCANNGAVPNLILASPFNMGQIQKWDNYQTKMQAVDGTLKGTFDAILTPFGLLQIRYDAQMRSAFNSSTTSELLILDTNFWEIDYLRPLSIMEFAKTGDTVDPKYMVQEFTLEAKNEKSSGGVFDLAVS